MSRSKFRQGAEILLVRDEVGRADPLHVVVGQNLKPTCVERSFQSFDLGTFNGQHLEDFPVKPKK